MNRINTYKWIVLRSSVVLPFPDDEFPLPSVCQRVLFGYHQAEQDIHWGLEVFVHERIDSPSKQLNHCSYGDIRNIGAMIGLLTMICPGILQLMVNPKLEGKKYRQVPQVWKMTNNYANLWVFRLSWSLAYIHKKYPHTAAPKKLYRSKHML